MKISRWGCCMLKLEDFANWYNNTEKFTKYLTKLMTIGNWI